MTAFGDPDTTSATNALIVDGTLVQRFAMLIMNEASAPT